MIYVFYDDGLVSSSRQAKEVAVTTVSQLLDVREDVFQEAVSATEYNDSFAM